MQGKAGCGVPILVIFWNRPAMLAGLLDALETLQPSLMSCTRRGARVVTFVNHLKTEFRKSSFGDILRLY